MNTDKLASEAADQIAMELFSRFGINLPPAASKWLDDYVQSIIEKVLSGQRIYGAWGTAVLIDDEFSSVKGRAAHASDQEWPDVIGSGGKSPSEAAHASEPCPTCGRSDPQNETGWLTEKETE